MVMMAPPERGNMRFRAERRQYGGLLMLTGFCAVIRPLANIATLVGIDGPIVTDASKVALWEFVGSCCLFAIGSSSVLVGYLEFIHDWGEISHSTLLIVATQSAFIPYVTQMAGAGKAAVKDPPQFFVVYPNNPAGIANANELNHKDVKFLGSMGIIGIFAYGLAFIGAIAFMQFALRAFRTGNPHHRNAAYYRSRLTFYSFLLFLAGMVQILVGSFATKFNIIDNGRIAGGIVFTAMFVVQYPYLSIAVGIAQFLCGFWGFVRSFGVFVGDENDNYFQYSIALLWLITLTCQDIVQISLLPGGMLAPAAPTFAALSLGLHLMPAFLEYKMRSTPEEMDEAYYFAPESDTQVAEKRPIISRGGTPKRPLELRRVYVMERDAVVDVDEEDFYDGADGIDGQNAMQYVREGQQSI